MTDIRFQNGGKSPDVAGIKKIPHRESDFKVGGAVIKHDQAKINEPRGALDNSVGIFEKTPN